VKITLRRALGGLGFGAGLAVAATVVTGIVETVARTGGDLSLLLGLLNRRLLLLAGLAALLLIIGWRLAFPRPRAAASAPRPGAPAPETEPVPIPSDAVEDEEGEVTACLRCGSENVAPSTLDDGMILGGGETLLWVCRRCAWRGQPLTFADPSAYRQFVRGLHEAHAGQR